MDVACGNLFDWKLQKSKYKYQLEQGNLPPHLPEVQNIWRQCEYCYKEGV